MKPCSKCKISKPLDEFNRDSSRGDGLTPQCKSCRAAKAAERAKSDEVRARDALQHRARRAAKGEEIRAKERARRAANGDAVRAKERAYMAGYRANNADRLRRYHRDRYAADSGPKLEAKARRKAAKIGATVGGPVSYKSLRAAFPDCYLCNQPLTGRIQYDHVVPLQPRPGEPQGAHCTDNLRPTHERCNLRKGNVPLVHLAWYSGPTDLGVSMSPVH